MKIAHRQLFQTQLQARKPATPPRTEREQVDSLVRGSLAALEREPEISEVKPWPLPARVGIFTGFAAGVAAAIAAPQLAASLAGGTFAAVLGGTWGTIGVVLLTHSLIGEKSEAVITAGMEASWGTGGGILVGLPVGLAARYLVGL